MFFHYQFSHMKRYRHCFHREKILSDVKLHHRHPTEFFPCQKYNQNWTYAWQFFSCWSFRVQSIDCLEHLAEHREKQMNLYFCRRLWNPGWVLVWLSQKLWCYLYTANISQGDAFQNLGRNSPVCVWFLLLVVTDFGSWVTFQSFIALSKQFAPLGFES